MNVLLGVLNRLVDRGNTVLVIEHNMDVIKVADWVLDMGPTGGEAGGELVFSGTPEELVKNKKSKTARFVAEELRLSAERLERKLDPKAENNTTLPSTKKKAGKAIK